MTLQIFKLVHHSHIKNINNLTRSTYLFTRFEDVALKRVTASITGNVTKNFQVVAIMRDVEYPVTNINNQFKSEHQKNLQIYKQVFPNRIHKK